jgi:hypothetical protein
MTMFCHFSARRILYLNQNFPLGFDQWGNIMVTQTIKSAEIKDTDYLHIVINVSNTLGLLG